MNRGIQILACCGLAAVAFVAGFHARTEGDGHATEPPQATSAPAAAPSSEEFSEWVIAAETKMNIEGGSPEEIVQAVRRRLDEHRYISDETMILAVHAVVNVESRTWRELGGTGPRKYPESLAFIEEVLKATKDRPVLQGLLHKEIGELLYLAGDTKNAMKEYEVAVTVLRDCAVEVELAKMKSLIGAGGVLYQTGDREAANELYTEVLWYPWYTIRDDTKRHRLLGCYIRAGGMAIECRRHDLEALKRLHLAPAALRELEPALERAIREAQGVFDKPTEVPSS